MFARRADVVAAIDDDFSMIECFIYFTTFGCMCFFFSLRSAIVLQLLFFVCLQRSGEQVHRPREKLRLHMLISIFNVSSYYHVFYVPHSIDLVSVQKKSPMTSHDLTLVDSFIMCVGMVSKRGENPKPTIILIFCIKLNTNDCTIDAIINRVLFMCGANARGLVSDYLLLHQNWQRPTNYIDDG